MRGFMSSLVLAASLLAGGLSAAAQDVVPAKSTVQDIYAAGVSYSAGAQPAVAGTALWAHQVSADSAPGMYVFTVVDVLPNTVKPFTVTTNVAGGIAQKVATIHGVPIYVPTAAGISFTGTNTGWAWSTGGAALVTLKDGWSVMPTLRVAKSSVSNGTGYQLVPGVLFAWGKS